MSKASRFIRDIDLVVLFAALMLVSTPVSAHNAIRMSDRDGDGRLSPQKFLEPSQLFRRIGRDGDGFLSQEEMRLAGGQPGGQSSSRRSAYLVSSGPGSLKISMVDIPAAIRSRTACSLCSLALQRSSRLA